MIVINYRLSMPEDASIPLVERSLQKAHKAAMDLPVRSISEEVACDFYPQDEVREFGDKTYVPLARCGFQCEFGDGSSKLDIKLMKFPSEGRCPLYWFGEGSFWTLGKVADDVFLSRHRAACKILEKIRVSGFTVEVQDEGNYWVSHNLKSLLEFKHVMDRNVDPREAIVR